MQTDQMRQCFDDNSILGTKNKLFMLNIETQTKRNINLERERERDKKR
jgi:hypothetical protein